MDSDPGCYCFALREVITSQDKKTKKDTHVFVDRIMRVRLYEPELAHTKKQKKTSGALTWEERKKAAELFVEAVQKVADNCKGDRPGLRRRSSITLLSAPNEQNP
jgi:hypothetical protein